MTDPRLNPVSRVAEALAAAGLPVVGVREQAGEIVLDWEGEPTPQQQRQAEQVVASIDRRPRRRRSLADLYSAVQALAPADRNKLLAAVVAAFLHDHPTAARRLGIDMDGDEPAG